MSVLRDLFGEETGRTVVGRGVRHFVEGPGLSVGIIDADIVELVFFEVVAGGIVGFRQLTNQVERHYGASCDMVWLGTLTGSLPEHV